jgi:hypothetical protein
VKVNSRLRQNLPLTLNMDSTLHMLVCMDLIFQEGYSKKCGKFATLTFFFGFIAWDFVCFAMLDIKPRILHMISKCSTNELYPKHHFKLFFFFWFVILNGFFCGTEFELRTLHLQSRHCAG